MNQPTLFDAPATRGASRRTDPQTSRDAGRSMSGPTLRAQQRLVLTAVKQLGDATAWEIHIRVFIQRPFRGSVPKVGKKPKKKRRGMARPDEPLATYCEVGRAGVCTGRAEVRHHVLMRSQGGTDERSNTIDACDRCHKWIHDHPAKSYAWGWLAHAWDCPDEVEAS